MTNILTFMPASASSRGTRPRPQGPAAIVIFPGVRYERVAPLPPARGARQDGRAAARKGTGEPG
ncbi:hypothetical protein [Aquibium microcysteis]|uniref:hypothetical protein n=1 Tax=Aquibium microcysteis TaxID=675281 RepID=UPI00165D0293|nr:hypothetical protein [Aquibium microcysteis]